MKEKTIKTIANVTGFVAGLATEVVVTNLLCAHIPAKAVRGVVSKLVTKAGVGVLGWFVGCKVDDYVNDFIIDTAYEIENLKSDIEKGLNMDADNTEVDSSVSDDKLDIKRAVVDEVIKPTIFGTMENEDDEDDISPVSYFEFAKYGDKDIAEESLSRFIGHLRGFMAYDIVTGKVRHFLNLNDLNPNEIYWVASLVNDFAQVVNVGDEWALFLPKPFNYRKWKGCEIHNG